MVGRDERQEREENRERVEEVEQEGRGGEGEGAAEDGGECWEGGNIGRCLGVLLLVTSRV